MESICPRAVDENDTKARDRWLRDMHKEMEKDAAKGPLPGADRNTCSCGHRVGEHFQGNRAMPCSRCSCSFCRCENAEKLRRDKAKSGAQDIHPHPEFERRRGR